MAPMLDAAGHPEADDQKVAFGAVEDALAGTVVPASSPAVKNPAKSLEYSEGDEDDLGELKKLVVVPGSTWASSTWTSETKHFTSLNVAFYAAMIVVFLGLWLRSSMVVTEAPEAWPPAVDIVIPQASTVEMQQALCDARNHPHTEYPFWSSQMGFTKKQDFQTCGAQDGWLKSFANNLIGHDPRKVPWTRVCQDASGGGICLDDKDGVTSSGLGFICACRQDFYCASGCNGLQRAIPMGGSIPVVKKQGESDTKDKDSAAIPDAGASEKARVAGAVAGAEAAGNSVKSYNGQQDAHKKEGVQASDDDNILGVYSGHHTCQPLPTTKQFEQNLITTISTVPQYSQINIGQVYFGNPGLIKGSCGPLQPTLSGGDLAEDGNDAFCGGSRNFASEKVRDKALADSNEKNDKEHKPQEGFDAVDASVNRPCSCGLALNVKSGWFGQGLSCLPSDDFIPPSSTFMGCSNTQYNAKCRARNPKTNVDTDMASQFNIKNVNMRSAPTNQWLANQNWPSTLASRSPVPHLDTKDDGNWIGRNIPQVGPKGWATTRLGAGDGSGGYYNGNVTGGQCVSGENNCANEHKGVMWLSGVKVVVCCPGEKTDPFVTGGLGYFGLIPPVLHNGGRKNETYTRGVKGAWCDAHHGCVYYPQCACPVSVPTMDLRATGPPTKTEQLLAGDPAMKQHAQTVTYRIGFRGQSDDDDMNPSGWNSGEWVTTQVSPLESDAPRVKGQRVFDDWAKLSLTALVVPFAEANNAHDDCQKAGEPCSQIQTPMPYKKGETARIVIAPKLLGDKLRWRFDDPTHGFKKTEGQWKPLDENEHLQGSVFFAYSVFVGNPESIHLGKTADIFKQVTCLYNQTGVDKKTGQKVILQTNKMNNQQNQILNDNLARWGAHCAFTPAGSKALKDASSGTAKARRWTVQEAPSFAESGPYDENLIILNPAVGSASKLSHGSVFIGNPGLIYSPTGARGAKLIDSREKRKWSEEEFERKDKEKEHHYKEYYKKSQNQVPPYEWSQRPICPLSKNPTFFNVANNPFYWEDSGSGALLPSVKQKDGNFSVLKAVDHTYNEKKITITYHYQKSQQAWCCKSGVGPQLRKENINDQTTQDRVLRLDDDDLVECWCGQPPGDGLPTPVSDSHKCFKARPAAALEVSRNMLALNQVDWKDQGRYTAGAKWLYATFIFAQIMAGAVLVGFAVALWGLLADKVKAGPMNSIGFCILFVLCQSLAMYCLFHLPAKEVPRSVLISSSDQSDNIAFLTTTLAGGEGIWY